MDSRSMNFLFMNILMMESKIQNLLQNSKMYGNNFVVV